MRAHLAALLLVGLVAIVSARDTDAQGVGAQGVGPPGVGAQGVGPPGVGAQGTGSQTTRPGSSAPGMEENRREARALAETLDVPRQAEALMAQMRAEIIQATIRSSALSADDAARVVDDILMPNFHARGEELLATMIEPYAVNFTFSDLRALRAFFASPLGQKLLRTQPVARAQSEQAGLAWGKQVFQDSVDRHVDELRARGLKF